MTSDVLSVGRACGGEDQPESPPANGSAADVVYPHRSVRRFELGDGARKGEAVAQEAVCLIADPLAVGVVAKEGVGDQAE